ncbi:MAG: response regulator transcription factor [Chloroflexi bacterium]|nr:response regulator transcription factor [Ardenticatenaceae bacterium]MBL1129393.1 DNA-binding response regulator [Chloroflexota bacterium]NOG35473.1 response regulator transcription factor [Chloroflexota bacterium]GIK57422.1 MAG: DNA-binding response regulator [Chloroflexota bacterium]
MAEEGQHPGRVLLVDDEANIREGLKAILQKDGHEVRDVGTAVAALDMLSTFAAEVAVLDIRMPGMLGTELLAAVKRQRPYLAVIMLTGHGTLETAMTAVKEGAFDYLLKPARPDDLRQVVWRALATARRQREQAALLESLQTGLQRLQQLPATSSADQPTAARESGLLKMGDLVINQATHEVHYRGELLSLTPTEYSLLLALAEQGGAVMDYVTLTKVVLAYEAEPWEAKELIKRHIYTLRQKMEPQPDQPQFILNVRGVGYRLAA